MRYLLFLLFNITTALTNGQANGQLCVVRGQLTDPGKAKEDSYLNFYVASLYGDEKNSQIQSLINEKGEFRISFYLPADREIKLRYDSKDYFFIFSPGDSGFITFDNSRKSLRFSGDHAERNNQLQQLIYLTNAWLEETTNAFIASKELTDEAYGSLRLQQLAATRTRLAEYFREKNVTDPVLRAWALANLEYTAGFDLCIFPFLGKRNESLLDTDPYFDFIGKFESDNSDGSPFFSFSNYIKQLQGAFEIICNINKTYKDKRPKQQEALVDFYCSLLKRIRHPLIRSKTITRLYASKLGYPGSGYYDGAVKYIDSLYKYGDNTFISTLSFANTIQNEARVKTLQQCISEFDGSPEEKKGLQDLFAASAGKVVYMDFWFTNCAPCMRELPYYNALIDKLNGKPVQFIFFGAYMDNKEWKDAREKFKLKGTHYLLTKNQVAFFEKYFGLNSYPHHSILKRDQTIIKFAPGFVTGGSDEQVYNELYRLCY